MTDSTILEMARLGDPQAIESLMNQSLQSRGMQAKVDRQGDCLEVILEAERVPNRQALTAFVQKGINNLGTQSIRSIRILGQQTGASYPAWMQELQLESEAAPFNIQPETGSDLSDLTDPTVNQTLDKTYVQSLEDTTVQSREDTVLQGPEATTVGSLDELIDPVAPPDPASNSALENSALEADLWTESAETPDFLQELVATPDSGLDPQDSQPESQLDLANFLEENPDGASIEITDESVLSFLDELEADSTADAGDFPDEMTQTQSAYLEELPTDSLSEADFHELISASSEAIEPMPSELWEDSSEQPSTGEPDADLIDFLNQPIDPVALDELGPDDGLFNPTETAASEPDQVSEQQIEELFAAEPVGDTFDEITEEPLETLSLETDRDLWIEGSEDQITALPELNLPEPEPTEIMPPAASVYGTADYAADSTTGLDLAGEALPENALVEDLPTDLPAESRSSAAELDAGLDDELDAGLEELEASLEDPALNLDAFSNEDPAISDFGPSGFGETRLEPADLPELDPLDPLEPIQHPVSQSNLTTDSFALENPDLANLNLEDDLEGDVEELPPDFLLDLDYESLEFSDYVEPPGAGLGLTGAAALDLPPDLPQVNDSEVPTGSEPAGLEPPGLEPPGLELVNLEPQWEEAEANLRSEAGFEPTSPSALEAELASLELTPPDDLPEPTASELALELDEQPDSDLAELLSETPEGTAIAPEGNAPQPADFVVPGAAISPNLSQDTLEQGLGDYREGFVEPPPDDLDEVDPDWQRLREPLDLDADLDAGSEDADPEANYVIEEENSPEYQPPVLPPVTPALEPEPESRQPSLLWVLLPLSILIGGLLGYVLLRNKLMSPPPSEAPTAPAAPTSPAPAPPAPASPSSANPASPADAFQTAVARADSAVTLGQTAQSVDDWKLVASRWQQAIELLKGVPAASPNHSAAQQKLAEYQNYLTVAQAKANQPIVAAVPLGAANIQNLPDSTKSPAASPTGSPVALTCNPITSKPDSQPVELSLLQLDPIEPAAQAQASPLIGCITNHTEKPIAAVDVAYSGPTVPAATGKLTFTALEPRQTVPFKSEFTLAPEVKDLTIANISWTVAGSNEAQKLPATINITRPEKNAG
jgi:hypothetical protein